MSWIDASGVRPALHLAAAFALFLFVLSGPAAAQDANECDEAGEVPNLVVGDIPTVNYWGTEGSTSAFSIATTKWLNPAGKPSSLLILSPYYRAFSKCEFSHLPQEEMSCIPLACDKQFGSFSSFGFRLASGSSRMRKIVTSANCSGEP